MTLPASHQTIPAADLVGLRDPILQELWRIKAQLNAQANHSIEEIVRRLNERKTQSQLAGGIATQGPISQYSVSIKELPAHISLGPQPI